METPVTTTWQDGLYAAWHDIAVFVPKLIGFLIILAIGYFVSMALGKGVDKLLGKIGFNKAVDRGGIRQAMARSGYSPSDIVGKLVFYTGMLFTLELAFGVFGPNPISTLLNQIIAFLPNIFVAIVMVVIAGAVAAWVRDIVKGTLGGLGYGGMLSMAAFVSIWMVGIFGALTQLNIAPLIVTGLFYAILAAAVGIAIVAIGGGGIAPMRQRWDNALNRLDQEIPRMRDQMHLRNGLGTPVPTEMRGPRETPPGEGYIS